MGATPGSFAVWAAGVQLGLASLRRDPVLGLKRLALPASYWRTAEFRYVWGQLKRASGGRVLDLGSPKELAPILARREGLEVVSTDILTEEVEISARYSRAQWVAGEGAGCLRAEVQDGRALTYPSASFDAAYCISVLEHIPGDGDTLALRELLRVVKPGGIVVVTTPYDRAYRETYVDHDVYERTRADEPVFFERHYDEESLERRLLAIDGAQLIDLEVWGEGRTRMERLLNSLGSGRMILHPFESFLAATFLRRTPPSDGGHPMAVFFTLRKVAAS